MMEKACSQMNILRILKFTIDRKSLETIYFTFIRSMLEYANILWDNCSQQECNEIDNKRRKRTHSYSLNETC